jgi:hypothetical protein
LTQINFEASPDFHTGVQFGEDSMRAKIVMNIATHIEAERKGAEERFGIPLEPDTYADSFTFTMSDLEKVING